MAINLLGRANDQLTVGHQVWCAALELAQQYGWRPQGTHSTARSGKLLPDMWDGNYLSAEEQEVDEDDAWALAHALRRALDDLPDHDALAHKQTTFRLPFRTVRVLTTCDYSPIELLGGANKPLVERVIALGERGGFRIGAPPVPVMG